MVMYQELVLNNEPKSVISETIEMRRSGATPNRSFFGRR